MQKKYENIVLKILKKDLEEKIKLFDKEFEHIKKIENFFCGSNNNVHNTSLGTAFCNIQEILNHLDNNIKIIHDYNQKIRETLDNILKINSEFSYKKEGRTNKLLFDFFDYYTIIKNDLNKLTENFNFLQRKIINIINSYPFYYPTPKISSYREASKIHFLLEWVSKEFLELVNKKLFESKVTNNLEFKTSFYWNYEKEIKFIPKIINRNKDKTVLNFVINSDSYLPYRRSHYILILHECLHFYIDYLINEYQKLSFNEKNRNINDDFPEFLLSLQDYIKGVYSVLNDIGLSKFIDFNEILDIFIDTILTEILGLYYYIPLLSHIFAYDEGLFRNPEFKRIWTLRASIPLKIKYSTSVFEKNKQNLKDEYVKTIDKYKEIQARYIRQINEINFINDSIEKTLVSYIQSFLQANQKSIKKLKIEDKDKCLNEQNECLSILVDYQIEYINDILEKFYANKKDNNDENGREDNNKEDQFYEGRTLAVKLHNKLLKTEVKYDLKNVPTKELKIFSFYYIKARANDKFGELISQYINGNIEKYLLNYGSYSFLAINEEGSERINLNQFKDLQYYINNYELTLYDGLLGNTDYSVKLEKIEKIIEKLDDYIFINIKLLLNRTYSFNDLESEIKKQLSQVSERFGIEIEPFYFISFDWFDLFITLAVSKKNKETINLTSLLSEIKQKLLAKNKYIHKSETEIFLGKNIIEDIEIENPKFQIRLSSGHDPNVTDNIYNLLKDKLESNNNLQINYLYGIRDLEIIFKRLYKLKFILKIIKEIICKYGKDISDIQFIPSTTYTYKNN